MQSGEIPKNLLDEKLTCRESKILYALPPPTGGQIIRFGGRWQVRGPNLLMKKGELSVSVLYHPLRKQLVQNVNLYRKGTGRIVSDPEILSGARVFKGTTQEIFLALLNVEVHPGLIVRRGKAACPQFGEFDLPWGQ